MSTLKKDYCDVKDRNGNTLYQIKECIDDFPYQIMDKKGRKNQ